MIAELLSSSRNCLVFVVFVMRDPSIIAQTKVSLRVVLDGHLNSIVGRFFKIKGDHSDLKRAKDRDVAQWVQ